MTWHRIDQARSLIGAGYSPTIIGDLLGPPRLIGNGAGPQIVRAQQVPQMRPLVLTCPNCVAPLDASDNTSADGLPAKCRYCNVPLRWEPAVPIDRDDQAFRYEAPPVSARSKAAEVVRGVGPVIVHADSITVITIRPTEILRPRAIWVSESIANNFAIADVRIGHNSLKFGSDPIPCNACSKGDGLDIFCDQTVSVGETLRLDIQNLTACDYNFHGIIRGTTIT